VSLRFLYLIFGRLLSWLVLPSREWSSNDGTELTDRILIFGEQHLSAVLPRYSARYKGRRPDRPLSLRPPCPDHAAPEPARQRIRRRPILGGLINEYERAA